MMSFCPYVSSRCRLRPMRLVKAASVSLVILIIFNLMISDIGYPRSRGGGDPEGDDASSVEKGPTTLTPDVSFLLNSFRPSSKPPPEPSGRSRRAESVDSSGSKISSKGEAPNLNVRETRPGTEVKSGEHIPNQTKRSKDDDSHPKISSVISVISSTNTHPLESQSESSSISESLPPPRLIPLDSRRDDDDSHWRSDHPNLSPAHAAKTVSKHSALSSSPNSSLSIALLLSFSSSSSSSSSPSSSPKASVKSLSESVILPDHPLRPRLMAEPPTSDRNATKRYRDALRKIQLDINVEQFVHNSRKFGVNPLSSNPDLIVVVVQVHNRSQYLQHLVDSFRKATNVKNILLIFSHDFYSEKLNEIVDKVDFCPVLQIYYPYTIQAFPDQFPGKDPKDCPRDIGVVKAKEMKCNNYKHPDKFGHYREAKYTATKHHWWWKIHRIFDELDILTDYNGPVLILEEDHYVAPDFLPVLRLMLALKQKECDTCSLIALGNYDKKPSYKNGLAEKVSIESWVSSKHNMGMVVDRKSYDALKKCHKEFCKFDDYNWDWSLQFISATCLKIPLQTMVIKSPRVFHIGECGLHHKGKNCTTEARVNQISKILVDNKQLLFPKRLSVLSRRVVMKPKPPKPNGGWGDIRDHELCFSYVTDQNQA